MTTHIPSRNLVRKLRSFRRGLTGKSAALAASVALSACTGGGMAAVMPGEEIVVEGDVFSVTVDGPRAVAMNFATGAHNQDRLFAHAETAIARASGCAVAHLEQEPGVNTYRARLDCA